MSTYDTMATDYFQAKKWRRTALILCAPLVLSIAANVYQAVKIYEYEQWMVKAYYALQFCSQMLHGDQSTQ